MLKRIPDSIQDRPFDEITRDDVQKVVYATIEVGLARSTAIGIIRTISSIYGYAADAGVYLGANVAAKPSRILEKIDGNAPAEDDDDDEQIDCLDKKESDHLLDVVERMHRAYYPIILFALRTGARQGEQIGVAWDDIDWDGRYVTIRRAVVERKAQSTKNRRTRRIPLTPRLMAVLKGHQRAQIEKALAKGQKPTPWVFPNAAGGFTDPSRLRKEYVKALKAAGLRYVEYRSLRNTALTIMAENGVPQTSLQRIAGHGDINVTAKYYLKVKPEAHKATLDALSSVDSEWNANADANTSENAVTLGKI
jgi:integrase